MKKYFRTITIILLLYTGFSARAGNLINYPLTLNQPNGMAIYIFADGDEYYHWMHDSNNYTIIVNEQTGYYVYARLANDSLAPTSLIVGVDNPAINSLQPGINISQTKVKNIRETYRKKTPSKIPLTQNTRNIKQEKIATSGTINNIIIFIRFSNESEYTDDISLYNDMFNNSSAGYNSLRNYFNEVSYNHLSISSTFYPVPSGSTVVSYIDSHPRNYYQPYNATTNPNGYNDGNNGNERTIREHTLLKNAVNDVSSQILSSLDIDSDNDGYVDNVCFIIEGDCDGWSSLLWPHQWALYSENAYINGKQVWDYNFQIQIPTRNLGVGVLCHEMFHSLGSPDLYHYSQDGLAPVGSWDLMENTQNPPQHMGAYMKYKYGNWIDSIPVISPGTYSIKPLSSPVNNCYKIVAPCLTNEYFVLEYRKKEGVFEISTPASGLLIYRINPDSVGNKNGPPDEVYIYRPGGTINSNGSIEFANFCADEGRTSFNLTTDPKCFLSDGIDCGLNIYNISEIGDSITFSYETYCGTPVFLTALYITEHSADLGWSSTATQWQIEYGPHNFIQGTGIKIICNSNPYILSGLSDGTNYDYCVRAICGVNDTSAWSAPISFTTVFQNVVKEIEYFIDTDPGFGNGTSVALTTGSDITSNFNIPLNSLSTGFHILYVRVKDNNGIWSSCQTMPFYHVTLSAPNITKLEYFLDNDPGLGNGTSLVITSSSNITKNFTINLNSISSGFHLLYIRAKDNSGKWSIVQTQPFYNTTITNPNITKLEYFIDTDPGFGNGTNLNINSSADITKNLNIPLSGINDGFHILYLRAKDNQNKWSLTQTQSFYKVSLSNKNICRLEYYIDSDPGFGNGIQVSVNPSSTNISKLFNVDLACVPAGNHIIYLRAMDTHSKWSLINIKSFTVNQSSPEISYTGSTTLCQGDSLILKAPTGPGVTYQWAHNGTDINGATDSIYIAKTSGIYKVFMHHTIYNTCDDSTSTTTITVNSLPAVAGTISGISTICPGQNSVIYSVPNITDATSYIWTLPLGATGTSSTNTITVDYGLNAVSGNITVKGHNLCGDGVESTLPISVNGHVISGKTRYAGKANAGSPAPNLPSYNSAIYNISKVIVILKDKSSGNEIARDTSDALGMYQLICIPDGIYSLSYDKYTADTMQSANGVDAIDVTLLKYFVGIDTLVDPSRNFSSKYKKAINVDNNLSLNAIDISRIKAKIGSPYNVGKNFPKGNWVTLDTSVTIAGSNLNITLKTICYGDYNASSIKYRDSLTNWNGTKSLKENIISVSDDYITTNDLLYFEVPLRISSKMDDFSALGLELYYDESKYNLTSAFMSTNKNATVKINPTLEEIIAKDNDLLVTDEDGVIRVVYATTNHLDVNANDPIITLGFSPKHSVPAGTLDFSLTGTGVIGDQYGNESADAFLMMPKLFIQGDNESDAMFKFSGYPNPFSGNITISYYLPENGNVNINVFNALGERVALLVNELQTTGNHNIEFSGINLPAGIYSFKLEFEGSQKSEHCIIKLIKP